MTANQMAVSHAITEAIDLQDVVERELRENATQNEIELLHSNPGLWKIHLLNLKRKTEVQFTASKTRLHQQLHAYQTAKEDPKVSDDALVDKLLDFQKAQLDEKQWRSKANFFLSRIENRLLQLKMANSTSND